MMQKKWIPMLVLACAAMTAQAQQAELDQLKSARAELLAPRAWAQAGTAAAALQKDTAANAKADRLQKRRNELQKAVTATQQAIERSSKALASVILAYDDAVKANAAALGEAWTRAEQRFKQAVAEAEGNDLGDAKAKGAEAEVLLREVELSGIKTTVLGEARQMIAAAQAAGTPEFAPRSFAVAQQQLALAGQQLTRNRYELAEPQKLAAQAVYEARHAQYLAQLIERAQSKDGVKQQVAEQQLLIMEDSIRQLVMELEVPAVFDQGYAAALNEARTRAQQQQQALLAALQAVRDREQDIADLKREAAELKARLGGENEERQVLLKRLSAQERLRQNISDIEAMFSNDEGRVYRQGNQLVMSLNAISFRSGKSTIEPASFAVLAKVSEAIKRFPAATLTVEGHTDSAGGDSTNLLLSQDRADAVRQYLVSNLGVSAEKISSMGYGESKPIASNETDSGRARNRRIDVVMDIGAAQ